MIDVEKQNEELVRAYQLAFGSPSGQRVLLDLMAFCKFRAPIADPVDEGKRQALLRIMNFTTLSMEQLQKAYRGETYLKGNDDE